MMSMRRLVESSVAVGILISLATSAAASGPLSAEQAADQFKLHPDCRIELVAAEPDVIDPVFIEFAPDGKLWVVEYSDYPNGPEEGSPGMSRIRVLTDANGDGRYTDPVIFKDKMLFTNSLKLWRDGVIITTHGKLMFLKDTTGDGQADHEEVWFEGFATDNPQLRANHPTLGPDNWIYVANGLRGGEVVPGQDNPWGLDPESEPVSISSRDFRFHPVTGEYEAINGLCQFSLTFDDWGNRFLCSNRNPNKHVVFEGHHLEKNPWLRLSRVEHDVSPAGDRSRLHPISDFWTTSNLHENQFTAACGVIIYRGHGMPEEFYGNSFTCEPTGNLVHRDVLIPTAVTFDSRPGREEVEFLATEDQWFRPVKLAHGPDGALYVVDMYRAVIEHPQYMPAELKDRPDLWQGNDRGRIWRVTGKDSSLHAGSLRNDKSDQELIGLLSHPNAWQRETAKRLLFERADKSIADDLRAVVRDKESGWGAGLALWLLDHLEELAVEDVAAGFEHPYAERQALLLGKKNFADHELVQGFPQRVAARFKQDPRPLPMAESFDSKDPHLFAQVLLNYGWDEFPEVESFQDPPRTPRSVASLLLLEQQGDPWYRAALAISVGNHNLEFTKQLFSVFADSKFFGSAALADDFRYFSEILGRQNHDDDVATYLTQVYQPPHDAEINSLRRAVLLGLLGGLPGGRSTLLKHVGTLDETTQAAFADSLNELIPVYADGKEIPSRKIRDIRLLSLLEQDEALPILHRLAASSVSSVASEAVGTLRTLPYEEIGPMLVELLPSRTPRIRREMLSALVTRPERIRLLLDEVEAGRVTPLEIDQSMQRILLRHQDAELRKRAEKLVKPEPPEDRQKVLAEYRKILEMKSDPRRGMAVFEKNCAVCHRIGGVGVNVAPDISDSRTKTPETLLTNILDPNRAIDANYFSYTVLDVDGRIHTGIIESETSSAVTLKQPEGKRVTIPRDEIETFKNNGVSLMPVGLEKTIDPQQMADLISFIKNWRYLDGQVPKEVIR